MRVLEIGAGATPTVREGWEHLDVRDLPGIEHVRSAVDLSGIADGAYGLIVAKDVIEHLSWRDVPRALREWRRVLELGGHLEVETPNALELADLVTNPTAAGLHRFEDESDWQRFCRVAFGHQDHAGNFHGSYFTREWLTALLSDAGFSTVGEIYYNLRRFALRATK